MACDPAVGAPRRAIVVLAIVAGLLVSGAPGPATAADRSARPDAFGVAPPRSTSFSVNEAADGPDAAPGDGVCATRSGRCTLRAAIMEANGLAGPSAISLPPGVYKFEIGGADDDAAATGDLDIRRDLTISGAGPGNTFVQGAGKDRVLDVHPGANVAISGARIRRGTVWNAGGGGIRNAGNLSLADVIVSSNKVFGGAGGGIFTEPGSSTTLTNVTVWHNKATGPGDGPAGSGGGIFNQGNLTLTNVTVSNNQALGGAGGGILNRGTITIISSTFSANTAPEVAGGAIANAAGSVQIEGSIVANSLAGGDCSGPITSRGHNLIEDPAGCLLDGDAIGNIIGRDPMLGELIEEGPHAGTRVLRAGSPAIDAGANDGCPARDQRGAARPRDGDGDGVAVCDIGAFELQPE